jgi:hypothetical protein
VTLTGLLSKARILENSEQQDKSIEEHLASTNIQDKEANFVYPPRSKGQQRRQQRRNCGLSWPHRDAPCPAKEQTCQKCNKQIHYANRWEICLSMRAGKVIHAIAWNTRNACLQKGTIV